MDSNQKCEWTLIKSVKSIFHKCKDVLYGTILNFVDNYCPLVLSSHDILFKTSNFPKYYESIVRIWIMMYTLHRDNYRKSLLIWMSFVKFWMVIISVKEFLIFSRTISILLTNLFQSMFTQLYVDIQLMGLMTQNVQKQCRQCLRVVLVKEICCLYFPQQNIMHLVEDN